MDSKKIRVNITISSDILQSIDYHARIQGLSRSAYITKLENDENRRMKEYLKKYVNDDLDYYGDLPLDTPYLKAVFNE